MTRPILTRNSYRIFSDRVEDDGYGQTAIVGYSRVSRHEESLNSSAKEFPGFVHEWMFKSAGVGIQDGGLEA